MTMKTTLIALVASLVMALAAPAFAQKTAGDMVDDGTIAASIKAGLLDNKATSSMQINVESYKGTVQLSGFVEIAGREGRRRQGRHGRRRRERRSSTASRSRRRPRWAPSSTTA